MKRKNIIPYDPKLKCLARELRKKGTLSEVLLWKHLKGKQMMGYDFDRQKPIGDFIVDFFCNELMLAIEIDGETHNFKADQDRERQSVLEAAGLSFLRFTDDDVKQNIEGVVAVIEGWIKERGGGSHAGMQPPPLHPSREGTCEACTPPKRGPVRPAPLPRGDL